jgi:hypothetical protein
MRLQATRGVTACTHQGLTWRKSTDRRSRQRGRTRGRKAAWRRQASRRMVGVPGGRCHERGAGDGGALQVCVSASVSSSSSLACMNALWSMHGCMHDASDGQLVSCGMLEAVRGRAGSSAAPHGAPVVIGDRDRWASGDAHGGVSTGWPAALGSTHSTSCRACMRSTPISVGAAWSGHSCSVYSGWRGRLPTAPPCSPSSPQALAGLCL